MATVIQRKNMKRFVVNYGTIAEQVTENSFDDLDKAIEYCNAKVEGQQPYDGSNPLRNDYFWYEVWDSEIGVWNKDQVECESVYVTRDYWV